MIEAISRIALRGLVIGAGLLALAGAAQGQNASPFGFDNEKPEPPKLEETIYDVLAVGPTSPAGVSADGMNASQLLEQAEKATGEEAVYWKRRMIVQTLSDPDANTTWAIRALAADLYAADGQTKENMQRLQFLWQILAVAGDGQAMCNIGRTYKDGIGVPKDSRLARQWYERAETAGCKDAAQALTELGR